MKVYKEINSNKQNFLIISFFTKNIINKADRLIISLDKLKLNYKIFEIPSIHYSKSNKGSLDMNFCQPKLILDVIKGINIPILFVDSDIVFNKFPSLIFDFKKKEIDFAIYNWLEDPDNDGYLPFELNIKTIEGNIKKKFFINSVNINLLNAPRVKKQLLSSGAVIFFSNSSQSIDFLEKWLENIKKFPKAVDDQTLDYTYNFCLNSNDNLKTVWFDKSYCRYKWWIFSDPIINHPDDVTQRTGDNFEKITKKNRYSRKNVLKRTNSKIAKDHIIDIEKKLILKIENNKFKLIKKFNDQIFD